jgi:hypothetical protein
MKQNDELKQNVNVEKADEAAANLLAMNNLINVQTPDFRKHHPKHSEVELAADKKQEQREKKARRVSAKSKARNNRSKPTNKAKKLLARKKGK